MKKSIQYLVSVFKSQKDSFFPLLIVLLLSAFITSCKEESVPTKPHQNQILTDAAIAKLQATADRVMMEKLVLCHSSIDG